MNGKFFSFRCLSYSLAKALFDQSLYTTAARSATAPHANPTASASNAIVFLMYLTLLISTPQIIPNFPPLEAEKNCDIIPFVNHNESKMKRLALTVALAVALRG